MEKATIARLKNSLSAYLRKVRAGRPVIIYDRDVPIARIERIESSGKGKDRLAQLQSRDLVRPPGRQLAARELRALLAPVPGTARLSDALREERAEGR
jgi:antitoxin (DNA-binding transcriptional repressor) of toxin-antitoxin stability system